ncbi:MAG: GNAT family protein [Litorimonas sp.]
MRLSGPALRVSTSTEIALPGHGGSMRLRHPRWADYEQWSDIRRADADYLRPWEPDWLDGHLSRASYRLRLSRFKKLVSGDRAYPFHILRGDTLIGAVNLTHVERGAAQSAKLGYWVAQAQSGRGHARAAVRALTTFAFDQLALHRVEAAVQTDNAPSIRVLERNGYIREGVARGLLRIDGEWADHAIYAKLRGD